MPFPVVSRGRPRDCSSRAISTTGWGLKLAIFVPATTVVVGALDMVTADYPMDYESYIHHLPGHFNVEMVVLVRIPFLAARLHTMYGSHCLDPNIQLFGFHAPA